MQRVKFHQVVKLGYRGLLRLCVLPLAATPCNQVLLSLYKCIIIALLTTPPDVTFASVRRLFFDCQNFSTPPTSTALYFHPAPIDCSRMTPRTGPRTTS